MFFCPINRHDFKVSRGDVIHSNNLEGIGGNVCYIQSAKALCLVVLSDQEVAMRKLVLILFLVLILAVVIAMILTPVADLPQKFNVA